MKTLSFSVVEILPALLDRTKTQTIRVNRMARFKVGDKVRLYWKQRSSFKYFCRTCGESVPIQDEKFYETLDVNIVPPPHCKESRGVFHKLLGEVEITDVFEIKMYYNQNKKELLMSYFVFSDKMKIKAENSKIVGVDVEPINVNILEKDFWKLDGFKSYEDFKKFFTSKYIFVDDKIPKQFMVYRWKWL